MSLSTLVKILSFYKRVLAYPRKKAVQILVHLVWEKKIFLKLYLAALIPCSLFNTFVVIQLCLLESTAMVEAELFNN